MFSTVGDYKKKLIVTILIVSLLSVALNLFYKKQLYNEHPSSIDPQYVYYQGDNIDSLLSDNSNVEYEYTTPLIIDKALGNIETYRDETNIKVSLENIKWLKDSSLGVIKDTTDKINNNQLIQTLNISYTGFSKYMSGVNIGNEYLGIDYLLGGEYPKSQSEILIPEMYAAFLAQANNDVSYDDLLGTTVDISINGEVNTYSISGIYYGQSTDVFTPLTAKVNQMYKAEGIKANSKNAVIFKFSSKREAKSFITKNSAYKFYTHDTFKSEGLINKAIYLFVVIEYSLYFLLLNKQIKETKNILDHYQIKFKHWVVTYGLNFVIISLIIATSLKIIIF